jgi:hypothetical protein
MLVYRLSKSVYRKTKHDDKPTILNPFITSITVYHERRRQTGKVLVTGVSSFIIWFIMVYHRVLNDRRAKPAPRKGFPFIICITPIGGNCVDTPPPKWKPVRHLICRILGLSNGRSKLKSKGNLMGESN